jgi:uncharacterized damage-inducible protein DinB
MSEEKRHALLLQQSVQSIQELANEVIQTVTELPEDVFRWKPDGDIRSVREILGHVEEAAPYWTGEIQRVVANPVTEWAG